MLHHARLSVQWCAMLAMALDGLGCAMTKASQTFLIEQALCRGFYAAQDPAVVRPDGSVPEAMCKGEALQSQVALFAGTLDFSILITFYFYNTINSINWVLLSGLFDLVGGGTPVREILLYLYIAESVPEDGMTGTFNLLSAILIGMMSLGTFIGARLLNVNVFITCGLIIGVYVLLVPLVALFPHHDEPSRQTYNTDDSSGEECRSLMSSDSTGAPVPSGAPLVVDGVENHVSTKAHAPTVFQSLLRAATVDLYLSMELVVQTVRHPFTRQVMMLYFGSTIAAVVSITSPQWASGTFHSSLSHVDQVTAMEQVVSALTLFALPLLSKYVLRPRLHTKEAVDFCIIVVSLLASLSGVLVIAMAPSLAIYAVGVAVTATSMGLSDALRSFATSGLSNKDAVQRLYVSIRTVQTLAAIVGTPLWTGFFLWILANPGLPRGLLYLGNASMVFICLILTRSLRQSH